MTLLKCFQKEWLPKGVKKRQVIFENIKDKHHYDKEKTENNVLEPFPLTWIPVERNKIRKNKNLERRSESIRSKNALVFFLGLFRSFYCFGFLALAIAFFILSSAKAQDTLVSQNGLSSRCAPTREERLARVETDGRLVTEQGLILRLADIRFPDEKPGKVALNWLESLKNERLTIGFAHEKPDRWGEPVSDVVLTSKAIPLNWALVDAGLAMVDAGEAPFLCRSGLLAVEETARREKRGLWQEKIIVSATDTKALEAAKERFVIAEGKVRSLSVRIRTSYVNLGEEITRHLTILVPDEIRRALPNGLERFQGQNVRIRGRLDLARGPRIRLDVPEMLEMAGENLPATGR
jgi:endonuclease YncB( thermonuclease family)